MDTGPAGDASPWRIKVTVEAEPKDGSSPSKKIMKTTKVPLKGGGSSSPAKPARRSTPRKGKAAAVLVGEDDGEESEVKRPQRKRKGTPIRRGTRAQQSTATDAEKDGGIVAGTAGAGQDSPLKRPASRPARRKTASAEPKATRNDGTESPLEMPSASRRPTRRQSARKSLQKLPTERSKRLSQAREELDHALQDAVGCSEMEVSEKMDEDDDELVSEGVPGDMTVMDNEDFTMVSVETLQSLKQNTSLLENSGLEMGDKSAVSVSYWPSSPPQSHVAAPMEKQQIQYPDIGGAVVKAKSNPAPVLAPGPETAGVEDAYDAMSWKPTGPPAHAPTPPESNSLVEQQQPQERLNSEPSEWQREREAVSRQIRNAGAGQVVVINDEDSQAGVDETEEDMEEEGVGNAEAADIWAEEASRSLEEDQAPEHQHRNQVQQPTIEKSASRSPQLEDLFSDQPLKPPRPKIPRTWWRSSGMDFSYVDSPEHGALKNRNASGSANDEAGSGSSNSRRSSGVLTPPSTDDEGDTSLTQPDAAGTLLQPDDHHGQQSNEQEDMSSSGPAPTAALLDEVRSPSSGPDSGSDVPSPGGTGDTGIFWQTSLPNVYQRRRQQGRRPPRHKAMDLSELLNLDKSDRAQQMSAPSRTFGIRGTEAAHALRTDAEASSNDMSSSTRQTQIVAPDAETASSSGSKAIDSPLRKSLLKSSEMFGASPRDLDVPAPTAGAHLQRPERPQVKEERVIRSSRVDNSVETTMESFSSKASDQRQLLAEMNTASARKVESHKQRDENETELSVETEESVDGQTQEESLLEDEKVRYDEEAVEEQEASQQTRSYEEHLNLGSPQKIRVKFNDSTGNSSSLAPRKEYPPLFGKAHGRNLDSTASDLTESALKSKKSTSSHSVTLVPEKSFAPPPAEAPPGLLSRLSTTFWSAVIRPTGPSMIMPTPKEEQVYSPTLRTEIRSRYGVVSDQQPWTMLQMRVLHRMLNSCISNRYDSIIPKTGPLPPHLKRLIGKNLESVTDFRWTFTEQHAHVVDAYMQVVVPAHIHSAMMAGEIDFVGDSEARKYRGWMGSRHGDDLVFAGTPGAKVGKGRVGWEWVVKVLGNCVLANIETAKKEVRGRERQEMIRLQRREWERRNGIVDEEEEEPLDEEIEGSEVLERARRA